MPGFKARLLPAPFTWLFMKAFSREQTGRDVLQNARTEVNYFSHHGGVQISRRELKLNRLKLTTMRRGFNPHGKMHGHQCAPTATSGAQNIVDRSKN
jgi:hypothetical protein